MNSKEARYGSLKGVAPAIFVRLPTMVEEFMPHPKTTTVTLEKNVQAHLVAYVCSE